MAPKPELMASLAARNEIHDSSPSPFVAPSPRLERSGVQTRAQAAREAKLRTPLPLDDVEGDDGPCTPLHQGIPPQTTSGPPGAPRKTKARRIAQISSGAPVRKLDFDSHPFLDNPQPGSSKEGSGMRLPR